MENKKNVKKIDKIFNVISLITTIITTLGFIFCLALFIDFFIELAKENPTEGINIPGESAVMILYIIFGGIIAGFTLISLILSLIGVKTKKGKINSLINGSYIILEVIFFLVMYFIL